MEYPTAKKMQHNIAKKLYFTLTKWLANWHCAKSVVNTVRVLTCHTSYVSFSGQLVTVWCVISIDSYKKLYNHKADFHWQMNLFNRC